LFTAKGVNMLDSTKVSIVMTIIPPPKANPSVPYKIRLVNTGKFVVSNLKCVLTAAPPGGQPRGVSLSYEPITLAPNQEVVIELIDRANILPKAQTSNLKVACDQGEGHCQFPQPKK
jgi:hypothetical protein